MVEADTLADLERAFGPRTAMATAQVNIARDGNPFSLEQFVAIAHKNGVPVLIDAAADLPLIPNPLLGKGADLVAYSGGKILRGPQSAGILIGRKDLTAAAFVNSAPHHAFARAMKVSKEEVIGLVTALEMFAEEDEEALISDQRQHTDRLFGQIDGAVSGGVTLMDPDHAGRLYPTVLVNIQVDSGKTANDVLAELEAGEPSIAAMSGFDEQTIRLDVRLCEDWEIDEVSRRLKEILG